MFIEKLSIHGFKSFVDKVGLEFGSGLTGIIGPNGCGKTNITDAIRWVLGEQKASVLRGATMEDVIFTGSSTRKPLGMAEVSLTLSNQDHILPVDWPEVVVTRRVYRSGVSEYFLNKTPCRLRDIRDLFFDTGVGSHAYSVIERQMVDNVLSDTGGHRRFLFEEAAGVMKYKSRRKEALAKLEATEADLLRLNDIMSEVEREVRSLLYQASKARRWVRLRNEILQLELSVSAARRTELIARDAQITLALDDLVATTETSQTALKELEEERAALFGRQVDIDRRLGAARETTREAEARAAATSQELGVLRERQAGMRLRLAALDPEEERLVARIAQTSDRLREVEAALAGVDVEGCAGRLADVEARLARADETVRDLRERVTQESQMSLDFQRVEVEARAARDRVTAEIDRLLEAANRVRGEIEELTPVIAERATRLEEIDRTANDVAGLVADATKRAASAVERRAGLERQKSALLDTDRELSGRIATLRSREETIRELKSAWEGYDQGVRSLLSREDGERSGLLGVVADLIRVPVGQADWLEAALAGAVQCVITRDTDAAQAALAALHAGSAGKATLQPLDRVPQRVPPPPLGLLHRPGVIGAAIDAVECDDEFRPLARALFGRVVLVETPALAASLAAEFAGQAWRFVTPDGQVWSSEGWASGGAGGGGEGFLRREGELRELLGEIERREAEHAACTASLATTAEQIGQAHAEERAAADEKQTSSDRLHELHAERSSLQTEREHLDRRVSACTASLTENDGLLGAQRSELALLEATLAQSEDERARSGETQRSLGESLAAAEKDHAALVGSASELRVEVARITEQRRGADEERRRVADDLAESEALLTQRRDERASTDASIRTLETSIADATVQAEDSSTEVRRARTELMALDVERDDVARPLAEIEQRTETARRAVQSVSDEKHRLDLQLTEARMERRSLEERIASEYGVDLETLAAQPVPLPESAPAGDDDAADDAEGAEADAVTTPVGDDPAARLAALKEKFRRLGPVNELAVTEYQEKKERHDFLTRQREDLVAARAQLLEAIAKINQTAQTLFLDTFQQVQENLRNTFATLFVGGQAELVLVGDDPLEAEIDIRARPRGKQPQSLALLSGGEKALTAIALLFAIYQVKPSPFCILDEVDAPLDDANIDRFIAMLKAFSDRTQFIVVTHNKATMAASDAIYGVTMQEPGVSRLVSVRFEDRGAGGNGNGDGNGAVAAHPESVPDQEQLALEPVEVAAPG